MCLTAISTSHYIQRNHLKCFSGNKPIIIDLSFAFKRNINLKCMFAKIFSWYPQTQTKCNRLKKMQTFFMCLTHLIQTLQYYNTTSNIRPLFLWKIEFQRYLVYLLWLNFTFQKLLMRQVQYTVTYSAIIKIYFSSSSAQ